MNLFLRTLQKAHRNCCLDVPSTKGAVEFLRDMVALLFPVTHGQIFSPDEIEYRWLDLQLQFKRLLHPVLADSARRDEATQRFFDQVPSIYEGLLEDAEMFSDSDPASQSAEEIILCYPGFYALMVYRLSHAIYALGIPILPRILSEHAHSRTGIDIHPGATIGRHFYIDHGTGIVIGETTVIGDNVKVYQGVTLGATFVKKDLQGQKRHPTICDGVILYAGCTILGGATIIGEGSVIGGNVWLTESVAPHTKVFYKADISSVTR
ncbi:MAG: serine acetyltransferase [Alistipes sp.]|jgi:serine O-acetyltransferase|nr:serine acetyltransferase [Alistipes sp.]